MKNPWITICFAAGLLALVFTGVYLSSQPEERDTVEKPVGIRSVETTLFESDGGGWIRTWDVETGIVCYRMKGMSKSNSCAYTPEKPYPLRED